MLIRLRLSALQRYPHCLSLTITHGPSRSLMTGPARPNQLKKVTEAENTAVSTSLAAKAKENAKTGGYGLVIIGGLGLIAVVVGTILKELFSSGSANNIYDRAVKKCQEHDKIQDLLGEPIKAFGEESRRGRRNRVSQMPYTDKEGKKGMRVQFHLQGSRNRAVVEVDARENESGTMETRYIIVQVEDWLKNSVVVEDNRRK